MAYGDDSQTKMPRLMVFLADMAEHEAAVAIGEKRFGFSEPVDLIRKLEWEIKNIVAIDAGDVARAFNIMNFTVSAWHVHDWLWSYSDMALRAQWEHWFKRKLNNEKDFGSALTNCCLEFRICAQVANGVKHYRLGRDDPKVGAFQAFVNGELIPAVRYGDDVYSDITFAKAVTEKWLEFLAASKLLSGKEDLPIDENYWCSVANN